MSKLDDLERLEKAASRGPDGTPCKNCFGFGKLFVMQHVTYVGDKLTYESKPWVECDSCHTITGYQEVLDEEKSS